MSVRVYVFETPSVPPKRLTNSRVKERVKRLQQEFLEQFEMDLKLTGGYRKGYFRFKKKAAKDYTEILFYFCNSNKGIYFQEIVLPKQRRHQGIGTFFVNWLKAFGEEFGLEYIVLGSRTEAEGFWDKMGFLRVPYNEAVEKYPWMLEPVPTIFEL